MHKGRIGKWIKLLKNGILTLLFPERCVLCDRTVWETEGGLCPECTPGIIFNHEPRCKLCGKQIEADDKEYCDSCLKRTHKFDGGYSLCIYNDAVRKSIYRMKYKSRRRYATFYGALIARRFAEQLKDISPDALIPVPLHKSRLRKRGYNQAEDLARAISEKTGIPIKTNVVIRAKNTKALKLLDGAARQNNLKNAFKICANVVKLNTTVIIDDIYTTGSTVDELAAVLKAAGVQKVYFITVAAGAGR